MAELNVDRLERQLKSVYRDVAETPDGEFHFEMGRELAERLGYPSDDLRYVPAEAVDSFAGVGYHFDLAEIQPQQRVLDLGSGSGMDCFVAAFRTGESGEVVGVDITDEQIRKARQIATDNGFHNVQIRNSYIEELPFEDDSFDVVISNGVINLSAEKEQVFAEAERVLRAGGRLAISDIISEEPMPESIKSDADLWAACIGGAMQIDRYTDAVKAAGLELGTVRENSEYAFISDAAENACQKYGVKSISLGATKP